MSKTVLETKQGSVLVKNVYYLMAYAFRSIDVKDYRRLGSEDFSGMDDLLAAILIIGVESQRKRGFEKGYKSLSEQGWRIKGRVDMRQTMKLQFIGKPAAAYEYDEYNEDTQLNQILKTALVALMESQEVKLERRRRIRGALAVMQGVSLITDPARIRWSELRYHRNNRSYELLMNVCYLVIQQRLVNVGQKDLGLATFDDEQWFSSLFENFILNYYRRHYPQLHPAGQSPIRPSEDAPAFVPSMFTDVVLSHGKKTLIIDAKCYGRIFSMSYGREIMHSDHIRQIYYYASHMGSAEDVSAMLVYAGTGEKFVDAYWFDNGYELGCKTLDLNTEFADIAGSLDAIIERFFGELG